MIVNGTCIAFLAGILRGESHKRFRIALYGPEADLQPDRLVSYLTAKGEVEGDGYERGGRPLPPPIIGVSERGAYLHWQEPVAWPKTTIKAAAALIYSEDEDARAVYVMTFGDTVEAQNAPFIVEFPNIADTGPLISITKPI